MGYLRLTAQSISTPSLTIPSNVLTPAIYGTIYESNLLSYVDLPTLGPYSEVTITTQAAYFLSAGVAWTTAVGASENTIYFQVKRAGSTTWDFLAGCTTICSAVGGGNWRSGNVNAITRLFENDKIRVVYLVTGAALTLTYANVSSTGRVEPYFAINTNIP